MPTVQDDDIRAVWQNQFTNARTLDPEKLRNRARQFEAKTRRGVLVNQITAGLIMPIAAVSTFVQDSGLLARVACGMLLVTAAYLIWAFRSFFSALPIPADASAITCATVHKRQLERQRDMNLSARSAGPLILPIIVLVNLSRHWPDAETFIGPEGWGLTIATIVASYFAMQLAFIFAELQAQRCQREIDELEEMMTTTLEGMPDEASS